MGHHVIAHERGSSLLRSGQVDANESKSSVAHSRSPRYYQVPSFMAVSQKTHNHHDCPGTSNWDHHGSSFSSGELHKKLKPPGNKRPTHGISWTSASFHPSSLRYESNLWTLPPFTGSVTFFGARTDLTIWANDGQWGWLVHVSTKGLTTISRFW